MQYLVSVIDDKPGSATSDEMTAIDTFNDRLRADGHWVFDGGPASPGTATVADKRGGELLITDGPFLEPEERRAGSRAMQAADADAAVELAADASHDRH